MNLDKLSLAELKQLEKDVKAAIAGFETKKRTDAIAAAEAKAREFGYSLKDLLGKASTGKVGLPPKYANPANPAETWSGRGRQPAWFKANIAKGAKSERMLIK